MCDQIHSRYLSYLINKLSLTLMQLNERFLPWRVWFIAFSKLIFCASNRFNEIPRNPSSNLLSPWKEISWLWKSAHLNHYSSHILIGREIDGSQRMESVQCRVGCFRKPKRFLVTLWAFLTHKKTRLDSPNHWSDAHFIFFFCWPFRGIFFCVFQNLNFKRVPR